MSNPYYTHSGAPMLNSAALSYVMRAEFESIEDGMDKLPTLSGNADLPVFVNSGETGLTVQSPATLDDLIMTGVPVEIGRAHV